VSDVSDTLAAEPPFDFRIVRAFAAIDRRHTALRASGAHYAHGPAVDPDPDYTPRHRRTDAR
jgi:hypothetical protein